MSHSREDKIEELTKSRKHYRTALICFGVVFCISVVAYIIGEKNERRNIINNKYPLIDPAREIIPQENYVINLQSLRNYFISIGKEQGDNISIYYEQLNSGANISINKESRFYLASLTKLPVAMIATKKVEEGSWTWNKKFTIDQKDFDNGSGTLYENKNKTEYTLDELLTALLVDSDNTANDVLIKNFTQADFDGIVDEIGLEDVYDKNFLGSAKEYTRILRSLYTSSFLEREDSEKILDLMTKATWNKFLSQGLPVDVKFAHKYGENTDQHIFADSGIVYHSRRPYMLTVVYKAKDGSTASEEVAEKLMKEISEHAFNLSEGK
ncbi:class A beta-lactamase-related serine hydrolase [Patescibacteria group bacterium]|nr:class A beta-lactamase-related serine hydrolase [Patescibacteria group bacterium]